MSKEVIRTDGCTVAPTEIIKEVADPDDPECEIYYYTVCVPGVIELTFSEEEHAHKFFEIAPHIEGWVSYDM